MQNDNQEVLTQRKSFDFIHKLPYKPKARFRELFWYLGGRAIRGTHNEWEFPSHVNNESIAEVIRNTCFVCGGLMKNVDNNSQKIYEWGQTLPVKRLRKCQSCGHSHT